MKIAILSFYGRPKRFISSNRIYGLIRGLSKLGAKVYFFTMPTFLPPDECFDVSSLCEDIVEFSAIPIPLCLYETGRKIVQQVVVKNLLFESSEKSSGQPRRRISLLQRFWNWRYASPIFRDNTQTAGYLVLKRVTERRLLRYVQEHGIQVLFTSHAPPIAHEFGLYLKKRMDSHLFWIADFRDPLIDEYALVGQSGKLTKFQKEILIHANLLTMVSRSMIQNVMGFAQSEGIDVVESKFFQLYNGFVEIPECSSDGLFLDNTDRKLRICYTGTIFQGRRHLSVLFDAFSDLSEEERSAIEFIYAGPQAEFVRDLAGKYQLQSLCQIAGMVTKEMALRIQRSSDILLLLKSDADRGVFTGKFFEYLFSGRPILVVGDKDEEFNDVATRVGGVRIVPNGYDGSRQILEILRFLLGAPRLREAIEAEFGKRRKEEVSKFHWDSLSRSLYERIIQEMVY